MLGGRIHPPHDVGRGHAQIFLGRKEIVISEDGYSEHGWSEPSYSEHGCLEPGYSEHGCLEPTPNMVA